MLVLLPAAASALLFGSTTLMAEAGSNNVHGSSPTTTLRASAAMETTSSLAEVLGEKNVGLLSEKETAVLRTLLDLGQTHLFDWPPAGVDDAKKKGLAASLVKLDASYVGGLGAYITKSRALLASSAKGENPFQGLEASVPEGELLTFGSPEFDKMEQEGLKAAMKGVGFVLVAGGLGERLGYQGIKLELPVEGATGQSFLGLYVDYVRALSKRVGRTLPLCIMTSDDTDAKTRTLLEAYTDVDVTIIKQEKVAALSDADAAIAMDDQWTVSTKPHGHGDVHSLLKSTGIAEKWAHQDIAHLFFFQDTNALVLHSVLPSLGVSASRGFSMNSVCVPRRAGEAAGAIAKLVPKSSSEGQDPPLVINVEYNQLGPLLAEKGGDVNDPATGYSKFPGNANVLVVKLTDYVTTLNGPDKGVVDEFVNPKYKDETKTTFKKPTRLECMMQDYPKLLRREVPTATVGFTTFERWLAFSPAKNNLDAARTLADNDEPPSSASSTEFDFYKAHAVRGGLRDPDVASVRTLGGVKNLFQGPNVVFQPSFAMTQRDLREKIKSCHLDDGATLVVEGANVIIKSLTLKNNAALIIRNTRDDATLIVDDLVLDGPGLVFSDIPETDLRSAVPSDAIRGYTTAYTNALNVDIDQPGTFKLTNKGDIVDISKDEL